MNDKIREVLEKVAELKDGISGMEKPSVDKMFNAGFKSGYYSALSNIEAFFEEGE